jgi:uncharacterized membrane protein
MLFTQSMKTQVKFMKIKFAILGFAFFFLTATIIGCKYDTTPFDCSTVNATFSNDVQPLIAAKCAGCHNANNAGGGVRLDDYSKISSNKNGVRKTAVVEKSMPPSGPLSNDEMTKIQCWIDAGAPNN